MNILAEGGVIPCLSDEEMARVMDQAGRYGRSRAEHIRWKTLMALLINYGPRISEALLLRWEHVNFDQQTITFPTLKKFRKLPDGTRERLDRTRTLPLFSEVAVLLRAHRTRVNGDPRVFPTLSLKNGRHAAWRAFKVMLKRAGIPSIKLHGLRHSAGSRLAEIDPILAQKTLGHTALSTTTIYVHARRMQQQFAQMKPILGTQRKPRWPPAAADVQPSTDLGGTLHEGETPSPPGTVPWAMPWAGPTVEPQPRTDEELARRIDRVEGALIVLVEGLARKMRPKRENGHRDLPEPREPLALTAGDAPPGVADATGESPPASSAVDPAKHHQGEYLRLRDLAAVSSFSVRALKALTDDPTHPLPCFRVGGRIIVSRSEFEAWMEERRPPPAPDPDPTGILPVGEDRPTRPRTLLHEALKPSGLDRPSTLSRALNISRQRAHQILTGTHPIGIGLSKRIAAAAGIAFTHILEAQDASIAAARAGEEPALLETTPEPRSVLEDRLRPYRLDNERTLARAMKVQSNRADQLLLGAEFGRCVARKIARIIGVSAEEVLTWQAQSPAQGE